MIRGVFITGTDTGVGKTRIGAELARLLTARGSRVCPRKPVESGCATGPDGAVPADAVILREASGCREAVATICPWPLRTPVSPERAAELEGVRLDLGQIHSACLAGVGEHDFMLVEGAGGFHAPIARHALNADLAVQLGLPVLVVAADRLGTISHTLMTVEAIRRRGLALAGVVINQPSAQSYSQMDNAGSLERWLGMAVYRVPYELSGETGILDDGIAGLPALVETWLRAPDR